MVTKAILIAVSMVLFSACGRAPVDPAFQPYVDEFEQAMSDNNVRDGVNVEIVFGDTGSAQNGLCHREGGQTPKISISRPVWNSFMDHQRRILIYHELGHCVLGREHTEAMHEDADGSSYPDSLMAPSLPVVAQSFSLHRAHYVEELFRNVRHFADKSDRDL